MKYCIIITDGAADEKIPALGNLTPLEKANKPHLDNLAATGELGTVLNVPEGYPAGSDVAIMSLLGNDPARYYTGRAPIEAAARGIDVQADEWVFRCNLVTILDGLMRDHSAGSITSAEAAILINDLNDKLAGPGLSFYPGVSYRNLLVCKGRFAVTTTPPHSILDREAAVHYPTGEGAELLQGLITASQELLAGHRINRTRIERGLAPATSIWFWGEGTLPRFDSFYRRFGLQGAVIAAVDLVHGLGKLMGWELLHVQGATGNIDTNFRGKGEAAVAALQQYDLVCVHIEAPDEAGHSGNAAEKTAAIEQIDQHIIGPIVAYLKNQPDQWRILAGPDHPTPCATRDHNANPVPYVIAGSGIAHNGCSVFTEAAAVQASLYTPQGHLLMERFLGRTPRG